MTRGVLATTRALRRDPLTVLDTAFANRHTDYVEHSDFFHVRQGIFGPRSAQLEIARASLLVLRGHLDAERRRCPPWSAGRST